MIQISVSLQKHLARETLRLAGSLARLAYYAGEMPKFCEQQATGERIRIVDAKEPVVRDLVDGREPAMPEGAQYWRITDANGNVVMQGDGK